MTRLDDVQRAFAAELRQNKTTDLDRIIVDDNFSAQQRLNIYRNNIRVNQLTALTGTYPVIEKLLGSDFFRFLAGEYAKTYPSRSGDLRRFGGFLPEFLDTFAEVRELPYLADIARLEWACSVVAVAPLCVRQEADFFENIDPVEIPNLRFAARLSSRLVRSIYPILSIWRTNQDNYAGDGTVSLDEGAQSVLVVRPRRELELWPLDDAEFAFAEALIAGYTVGEAIDAIPRTGRDIELEKLFAKYLRSGAFLFSQMRNPRQGEPH